MYHSPWHKTAIVMVDDVTYDFMSNWCDEVFEQYSWFYTNYHFYFKYKPDLIAFTLRWL